MATQVMQSMESPFHLVDNEDLHFRRITPQLRTPAQHPAQGCSNTAIVVTARAAFFSSSQDLPEFLKCSDGEANRFPIGPFRLRARLRHHNATLSINKKLLPINPRRHQRLALAIHSPERPVRNTIELCLEQLLLSTSRESRLRSIICKV